MERIHHEMSEMRLDLGEVKRELNVVSIHMVGMQILAAREALDFVRGPPARVGRQPLVTAAGVMRPLRRLACSVLTAATARMPAANIPNCASTW